MRQNNELPWLRRGWEAKMGGPGSGRRGSRKKHEEESSQGQLVSGPAGPVTNPLGAGSAFMVRADMVCVDAELAALKLGDAKEPIPFSGSVKFEICAIEQAEALEQVRPGATCLFVSGKDTDEEGSYLHPSGQLQEAVHKYGPALHWTVVQLGEMGPMEAPGCARLTWDGPVRLVSINANNGTVTGTVTFNGSMPLSMLGSAAALKGRRVRVRAWVPQADLPLGAPPPDPQPERDFLEGGFAGEPEGWGGETPTPPPAPDTPVDRPIDPLDEELPDEAGT